MLEQFFLPDLELGQPGAFANEVDAEVVLAPVSSSGEHVLHGEHQVGGLEVPAPKSEAGRVEVGHLLGGDVCHCRERTDLVLRSAGGAVVLLALRQRGPDLAQERLIYRQGLIAPLEHRHALLSTEHLADQIGRERTEHHDVHHTDLETALLPQVVGHGLRVGDDRPLTDEDVLGVVEPVAHHPGVPAAGQFGVLLERLVRELLHVVEIEWPLRRHALHVRVLVLHRAQQGRVIQVEHLRDSSPGLAEGQHLPRGRRLDDVRRVSEIFLDEIPLGETHRLDHVAREEPVLRHEARIEAQLGDPVRDQRQVCGALYVLGEQLEEPGVVHGVVVVMTRVHVERVLGHGARRNVQHVREALAYCGVQRLVHIGDALAAREVGGPEPGHAHSGRDRRCGMLALRLEEQEPSAVHVGLARGIGGGPALAHLGRRGDRVRSGALAGGDLHFDHRRAAVHRRRNTRVPDFGCRVVASFSPDHPVRLPAAVSSTSKRWAPSTHRMAPVGQRAAAVGSARSILS